MHVSNILYCLSQLSMKAFYQKAYLFENIRSLRALKWLNMLYGLKRHGLEQNLFAKYSLFISYHKLYFYTPANNFFRGNGCLESGCMVVLSCPGNIS